ncbi:hypothetical protein RP20_CCG022727 [Aedes albopictus]|nr:hypothetical protein RP20_CCG022727 [Aedes albopictus]
MGKVCCIERCRNQSKASIPPQTVVSLYLFPQDDYCSNMWREFCRENGTTVTGNMEHRRICSRHFDDEVLKDPSDVSKGHPNRNPTSQLSGPRITAGCVRDPDPARAHQTFGGQTTSFASDNPFARTIPALMLHWCR